MTDGFFNHSAPAFRCRACGTVVVPSLFGRPGRAQTGASTGRPSKAKVVTLCGSTRFEAEFAEVNQRLTLEGCVVLSPGMFSLPDLPGYDWTLDPDDRKGRLGAIHLQKIRMADEVYVVDPGGYVGESTRREIAYAESLGKPVRYLSRAH